MDIRAVRPHTPFARAIAQTIDAWAEQTGTVYDPTHTEALRNETAQDQGALPPWIEFLLAFDVDYRRRRLHFMVEGLNRLYAMVNERQPQSLDFTVVDRLKRRMYESLDRLHQRQAESRFDSVTRALVGDIFAAPPSAGETREITAYAHALADRRRATLDRLITRLAGEVDLAASTRDLDVLLAGLDSWPVEARREVLINYLGFPFWDLLTFPVMTWREIGEFNEILVDRISPDDARLINRLGKFPLKGTGFEHFAAFLSRGYRENDYLLGRLHALDRLIDIVCDCAGIDVDKRPDILALKRRGLVRILDAEAEHLPNSKALISTLRHAVVQEERTPMRGNGERDSGQKASG